MIEDSVGAFMPEGIYEIQGAAEGALAGTYFAVKDIIDIEGRRTSAGNPAWLSTHDAAAKTAPCVTRLLEAGASVVGKTVTDELAYSLNGDNIHYGTPVNVNAPGCVPGGSSSGSAAAVAAGLCDFALGTDTGGSVRIPASYCGIFGIRTSHGRIPLEGVVPLMPSLDTVGWFARTAEMMERVGAVMLPHGEVGFTPRRLLVLRDAFALADGTAIDPLNMAIRHCADALGLDLVEADATASDDDLENWRSAFRTLSAAETWSIHGPWISSHEPGFSPAIAERFAFASTVSEQEARKANAVRDLITRRMLDLVGRDALLLVPSAPGSAPALGAAGEEIESFRQRAQRLTSIAGLPGLPQLSLPLCKVDGLPLGLSIIGPRGSDLSLLQLGTQLARG